MQTVIVGPGALGCLLAIRLHQAGSPVRLLDHDAQRAQTLTQTGFILETGTGEISAPIAIASDPGMLATAELVLLCVKAGDLPIALNALTPLLPPAALLIAAQNGISHLATIRALNRARPAALAVSTEGATWLAPGRVRWGGTGITRLGYPGLVSDHRGQPKASAQAPPHLATRHNRLPDRNPEDGNNAPQIAVSLPAPSPDHDLRSHKLAEAAALLNRAGLKSEISPDIKAELWRKLVINAGINALTVIYDCPNGALLEIPPARRTMAAAVIEAAAVAAACGFPLGEDPVALTEEVCRRTAGNISSMLQDSRRGRPGEIAAINGEIVRRAARCGLAVPVNRELLQTAGPQGKKP